MYYIELDDMYCIPTAEVPVTNIHSNEVLNEEDLPKNMLLTVHASEEKLEVTVKILEVY